MNMEGLCLSWERGRLARFELWRAFGPLAGETHALPGSILQGFRPKANGKST